MTADPFGRLWRASSPRAIPPGPLTGTIHQVEPFIVQLDSGQILEFPALGDAAAQPTGADADHRLGHRLAVGGRVIAVPFDQGHDYHIIPAGSAP